MAKHEKRLLDEIMPPLEIKDEDAARLKQLWEDLQSDKYTDEEIDAMIEESGRKGRGGLTEEEFREKQLMAHRNGFTSTYHPVKKKNK